MNVKTLILVIVGASIFVGIYLFTIVGALALLIGFGFGVWWHDWLNDIFTTFQKNIYFDQKNEIENRKRKLKLELEKINQGD